VSEPRDAESVAARLRFLRGSLGLSQEQLARRLGVSFATVNRWESGRTQLSPRAMTALAELEAEVTAGSVGTTSGNSNAASIGSDSITTDQLPVARSSFVGRDRELAELTSLIRQSRLVTLIGPGGAGKTRLATELLSRNVAAGGDPGGGDADIVFVPL
jgi:transcriptional regulator with XRE-family HTH domain